MEPANENRRLRPSEMDRPSFVETFGGVYEHSPWIAETAFGRGITRDHDNLAGLHTSLMEVVDEADDARKLDLLRAHPDLAGKLAVAGALTQESTSEQASAGLDRCTPEEFEEFQSLNDRYKSKFDFPFILAVRGRDRTEILEEFRRRLLNDRDAEFAEALKQVHRIARLRLEPLF